MLFRSDILKLVQMFQKKYSEMVKIYLLMLVLPTQLHMQLTYLLQQHILLSIVLVVELHKLNFAVQLAPPRQLA